MAVVGKLFGKTWMFDTLVEIVGSILTGVAIYNFALPAQFPMTGFSGLALILYRLFDLPIGVMTIVLNIPVAIICYRMLGRRFFLCSVRCTVFAVEHGARVHIADSANDLFLFSNGSLVLPPRSGWSLSVLAMTDVCDEVSIRGAKYPLSHVQVTNSFPIGISNEWQGNVEITVGHGVLMVISSKM